MRYVEGGICPIAALYLLWRLLTFWGHVTSSVRWPFHLQYAVAYRWPIKIKNCGHRSNNRHIDWRTDASDFI